VAKFNRESVPQIMSTALATASNETEVGTSGSMEVVGQ